MYIVFAKHLRLKIYDLVTNYFAFSMTVNYLAGKRLSRSGRFSLEFGILNQVLKILSLATKYNVYIALLEQK